MRRVSRKAVTDRELDRLCREQVFYRDSGKCIRCGGERHIQWCHVYSRRYKSLRWDTDNSMTLCAGCHLLWHHQPAMMVAWWASKFPDRDKRLGLIMQTPRKIDREAVRLALEAR